MLENGNEGKEEWRKKKGRPEGMGRKRECTTKDYGNKKECIINNSGTCSIVQLFDTVGLQYKNGK